MTFKYKGLGVNILFFSLFADVLFHEATTFNNESLLNNEKAIKQIQLIKPNQDQNFLSISKLTRQMLWILTIAI